MISNRFLLGESGNKVEFPLNAGEFATIINDNRFIGNLYISNNSDNLTDYDTSMDVSISFGEEINIGSSSYLYHTNYQQRGRVEVGFYKFTAESPIDPFLTGSATTFNDLPVNGVEEGDVYRVEEDSGSWNDGTKKYAGYYTWDGAEWSPNGWDGDKLKQYIDAQDNQGVKKPLSSEDNRIVRFDGSSGKIQNSIVSIDDLGNVTTSGTIVTRETLNADTSDTVVTKGYVDAMTKRVVPSTDNGIPRFDGLTGVLQDSSVTIDDLDNINTSGKITTDSTIDLDSGHTLTTKDYTDTKVKKVSPSINNSIPRFDGVDGSIKTSGVIVDDLNNITTSGKITSSSTTNGDTDTTLVTKDYSDTKISKPSPTVDNTIPRFNGVDGTLQISNVIVDDSNNVTTSGKMFSSDTIPADTDNTLVTKGYSDGKVPKAAGVTTDNAIVRFNGTSSEIQNSGCTITDLQDLRLGNGLYNKNNAIIIHPSSKYVRATSDGNIHYGYMEFRKLNNRRGGYIGYGDGASNLDIRLDDADKLRLYGGDLKFATSGKSIIIEYLSGEGKVLTCDANGKGIWKYPMKLSGSKRGTITRVLEHFHATAQHDYVHIRTPLDLNSSHMFHFKLTGYAYGQTKLIDITYAGYMYAVGNTLYNKVVHDSPASFTDVDSYVGSDNHLYLKFKLTNDYYVSFVMDSLVVGNGDIYDPAGFSVIRSDSITL